MRALWLALLCIAACETSVVIDAPTALVWSEVYEATCAPPTVVYVHEATCKGALGFFETPNGGCLAGEYHIPSRTAKVALIGENYSGSALAHELLHAWQLCRGIDDFAHEGDEWRTLEPAARQALAEGGF